MVMMTVNEYAKRMASSASQIRQMCADGIIPSVKIGKGYKIDVERAESAKKRAEERLQKKGPGIDVTRAEAALRRAMARIASTR